MTDPASPGSGAPQARPRPALPPVLAAAFAVLLAGVAVTALVARGAVEERITDRQVAAITAALRAQAPAVAALGQGDVFPGARPLQPIVTGARDGAGGQVRMVTENGTLLLETGVQMPWSSDEQTSAAFADGRPRSVVVDSPAGPTRITVVPLRAGDQPVALVAFTPARERSLTNAARGAVGSGALAGLAAGLAVLLLTGLYFRRKALIRSPKRS